MVVLRKEGLRLISNCCINFGNHCGLMALNKALYSTSFLGYSSPPYNEANECQRFIQKDWINVGFGSTVNNMKCGLSLRGCSERHDGSAKARSLAQNRQLLRDPGMVIGEDVGLKLVNGNGRPREFLSQSMPEKMVVAVDVDEGDGINAACRWFGDVVFHKGQFYTTVPPGWIMALDLASTSPRCVCLHLKPPPRKCCGDVVDTSYLVESPNGAELMLVQRIVNFGNYLTNTFKIFKCKLNNDGGGGGQGEAKWVEVKCLDEWVLFLGNNLSLALSARDFPELSPNSIYFTHSIYVAQREVDEFELGVFHLQSGTVEPLLFPNNKSWSRHMPWPVAVWIPHTECFPVATQITKVEDITKKIKFNFDYKKHRPVKVAGFKKMRYLFSVKRKRMKKRKYLHVGTKRNGKSFTKQLD